MRTQREMMELILRTAREDERIRAVYMGGSRCDPSAPRDIFQDYDIAYVVRETKSFQRDTHWIDRFGERLYMQYPEDNVFWPSDKENCYGWLIQFRDGVRMDLHVETLNTALTNIEEDSLCTVLLDKDGILPEGRKSSDRSFWVQKPDQTQFSDTCSEFWWCLNNLQKGIWRNELPYAQEMLSAVARPQLLRMLSWKIGAKNGFSISIGKAGKYMYRYLTPEEYARYLDTYTAAEKTFMWSSVERMCRFFDETAKEVAGLLGFSYNEEEAAASIGMFLRVRDLPKDARNIFG